MKRSEMVRRWALWTHVLKLMRMPDSGTIGLHHVRVWLLLYLYAPDGRRRPSKTKKTIKNQIDLLLAAAGCKLLLAVAVADP